MTSPLDRILERSVHELTLAVELADGHTDDAVIGAPTVHLTNAEATFHRTPSGFYVVSDLPPDPESLAIDVESRHYQRHKEAVPRDPDSLPYTVTLEPAPTYPFGGGQTLVRGRVSDGTHGIANATVEYVQGDTSVSTNPAGEYALPVSSFEPGDVAEEDGVRVVKPGGSDPSIEATHPDDDARTDATDVTLPVGGTASAFLQL